MGLNVHENILAHNRPQDGGKFVPNGLHVLV